MQTTQIQQTRIQRAIDLVEIYGCVTEIEPRVFRVTSQHTPNKSYEVNLKIESCQCYDFAYRRGRCKHILAALALENPAKKNVILR